MRDPLKYYFLEMREHFLDVPYLNRTRRIRVLLPKIIAKNKLIIRCCICTMGKIFSIAKNPIPAIHGRLSQP